MFEPIPLSVIRRLVYAEMMATKLSMPVAMMVVARRLGIPPIRVHFQGTDRPRAGPDEIVFINVDPRRFIGRTSVFPYHVVPVNMWIPRVVFCLHGYSFDSVHGGAVLYPSECFDTST